MEDRVLEAASEKAAVADVARESVRESVSYELRNILLRLLPFGDLFPSQSGVHAAVVANASGDACCDVRVLEMFADVDGDNLLLLFCGDVREKQVFLISLPRCLAQSLSILIDVADATSGARMVDGRPPCRRPRAYVAETWLFPPHLLGGDGSRCESEVQGG